MFDMLDFNEASPGHPVTEQTHCCNSLTWREMPASWISEVDAVSCISKMAYLNFSFFFQPCMQPALSSRMLNVQLVPTKRRTHINLTAPSVCCGLKTLVKTHHSKNADDVITWTFLQLPGSFHFWSFPLMFCVFFCCFTCLCMCGSVRGCAWVGVFVALSGLLLSAITHLQLILYIFMSPSHYLSQSFLNSTTKFFNFVSLC